MNNVPLSMLGGMCGLVLAGTASGDWILLEDDRYTESWAEVWSGGTQRIDAVDRATHGFGESGLIITGGFAHWDGANASSQSHETSMLRHRNGRIESRAHTVGHVTTNDDPNDAQIARTQTTAHFEMRIEITEPTVVTYDAWATGGATVQVLDAADGVVFEGDGSLAASLAAGEYRILAEAPMFLESIQEGTTTFGGSDYWFSIVIPTPGTAVGLLGLLWLRRRVREATCDRMPVHGHPSA